MAWATTTEVKQAVADALKRDLADLGTAGAIIDRQVAAAVEVAQAKIRFALNARYTEAQLAGNSALHAVHYQQCLYESEVLLREAVKDVKGQLLAAKDWTDRLAGLVLYDDAGVALETTLVRSGVLKVREDYDARRDWEAYRRGIVAGGYYGPGTAADSTDANW